MGATGKTILQALPWFTQMLDYTDQVCAGVTEETGGLKPTDPKGGYFFSVKELLLHIADSRWQCLTWLVGGEEERLFNEEHFLEEYGGPDKQWKFRQATVAEAQACLKAVRQRLEVYLDKPEATMLEPTDALLAAHEAFIKRLREAGKDTAKFEAGGPGNIVNALLFLAAHEQAHRATLQMILRVHGHDVFRVA